MSLGLSCGCTLCSIECQLIAELKRIPDANLHDCFSAFSSLCQFSSIEDLLSCLKTIPADADSDQIFADLFRLHSKRSELADYILVILFLPLLHRTVRLVARQQQALSREDIAQQSVFSLLQLLRSSYIQNRTSHFAFAISRGVKRSLFEWAKRESAKSSVLHPLTNNLEDSLDARDLLERHALLRHFLSSAMTRNLLSNSEVDLLVEFKLAGNTSEEFAALNGSSSNAVRQKFKRVLAKLRRLAHSAKKDSTSTHFSREQLNSYIEGNSKT